jgi:glycosyltransferase involved in cell wall biosynthesis
MAADLLTANFKTFIETARIDRMQYVHILIGSADPRSVNGVNKVVHWLATTQLASGLVSEVWSLNHDTSEPTHDRDYNLRLFGRTRSCFLLTEQLRKALLQLTPETWVQLHSVYIPELTAIARLLKKRGITYGVTTHGGYLSLYFDTSRAVRIKKTLFAALWENWMLRNAAMIHVIGATEVEDLQRRAPGQKMVLIPNGYAPDEMDLGNQLRQCNGPRFSPLFETRFLRLSPGSKAASARRCRRAT